MPKDVLEALLVSDSGSSLVVSTRGGPVLAAWLTKTTTTISRGGMITDEDFGPFESEAGKYFTFECYGDSRVRRYFQQRSIIDSKTHAPREHTWVLAYGENGTQKAMSFHGRLYNYRDEKINSNKAFKITGKIRLSPE